MRRTIRTMLLPAILALGAQATEQPKPYTEMETEKVKALNYEVQRVNTLYELANTAKDKADHAAADAQEHMAALKHELEAARPGWTVDLTTGKWTKTEPPKPKK